MITTTHMTAIITTNISFGALAAAVGRDIITVITTISICYYNY